MSSRSCGEPSPTARSSLGSNPSPILSLRLSALTLGEIQAGVEKLRSRNPEKAEEIENWADQIEQTFAVVPIDAKIYRLHARWMHAWPDHCYEDALIAATATIHDLTVVTRNAKDFARYDIALLDPFTFSGEK
jgi:predicted nucleic acid-binding protein